MSLNQVGHSHPKSLTELGACFGVISGGLFAIALVIKWLLHLTL